MARGVHDSHAQRAAHLGGGEPNTVWMRSHERDQSCDKLLYRPVDMYDHTGGLLQDGIGKPVDGECTHQRQRLTRSLEDVRFGGGKADLNAQCAFQLS